MVGLPFRQDVGVRKARSIYLWIITRNYTMSAYYGGLRITTVDNLWFWFMYQLTQLSIANDTDHRTYVPNSMGISPVHEYSVQCPYHEPFRFLAESVLFINFLQNAFFSNLPLAVSHPSSNSLVWVSKFARLSNYQPSLPEIYGSTFVDVVCDDWMAFALFVTCPLKTVE